jgi:hypothetical protein
VQFGGEKLPGPEELAAAERKYGRARVIQAGPRGITAYASIRGVYLGMFDMSQHQGMQPGTEFVQ